MSWLPDADVATGGRIAAVSATISGTGNPEIYRRVRIAPTSYKLPVNAAGTYLVILYLSETSGAAPGVNVFDVMSKGKKVASDVDAARGLGPDHAGNVAFQATTSTRAIDVEIHPIHGHAAINAISVSLVRAGTGGPVTLFDDEFDGRSGSWPQGGWSAEQGGNGWGNKELQTYTDRASNVYLDGDGHLVISALRQRWTGVDGITRDYTSGRLTTASSFSFRYGHVEARLTLPSSGRVLSGVWALGSDVSSVGWPAAGELDVLEYAGGRTATTNIHAPRTGGKPPYQVQSTAQLAADPSTTFVTVAMDWYPSFLRFLVDGKVVGTITEADLYPDQVWVFKNMFHLLLSVAVGGASAGGPPAASAFPQRMTLDYIRVTR